MRGTRPSKREREQREPSSTLRLIVVAALLVCAIFAKMMECSLSGNEAQTFVADFNLAMNDGV